MLKFSKTLLTSVAWISLHFGNALAQGSPLAPPPPESVPVLADADQEYWILWTDMAWDIGNSGHRIVVPAGFVTDFASIPKILWSTGLTPTGRYGRAAIIHDFLYWSQGCSREQSDRLLVIAMKESEVNSIEENIIYAGVSVGGAAPWSENRKMRESGVIRVVPTEYRNFNFNQRWLDYRKVLMEKSVRDPDFDKSPAYCKLGDSLEVPGGVVKPVKKDGIIIRLPGNNPGLQTTF